MLKPSFNYKSIVRILGVIMFIVGLSMIIPWIYAEVTGDINVISGFRRCVPAIIITGGFLTFFIRPGRGRFRSREGYIIVASCWLIASFIGAFPYYFSNDAISFIDAFFESVSGFTTTGCTAIVGSEMPKALLLWKAISHWLGGMGILVFVISILPALGINGQFIARAETPGPVLEKMTVRISDSAKILYITYFSFTIIEFILLMLSKKMSPFDAIVNTMGSISTGGLLVHPMGVSYYDSVYIEVVISVFCILASLNFVLYHYLITGKLSYFLKDIELRAYLIIIFCAVFLCTFGLMSGNGDNFGTALRDSFFQVVSMATTTGYSRSSYVAWPAICQLVLMTLMFIGGCSASTAGSIKVVRILVMLKLIWRGCIKKIHPRSVVAVKIGKSSIPAPVVSEITVFILVYMMIFLLSAFILSFQGLGIVDTMTATLSMLSNTGIAFGETTSMGDFHLFHPLLKLYLSCVMIMGRLELFTVIILFTRNFWGKDR